MAEETPTQDEVRNTVEDYFTNVEIEFSDLAGGVRLVVPEDDVGRMFGFLRREGYDYESKRCPSGDNVIYNIEAEESQGLGTLFA